MTRPYERWHELWGFFMVLHEDWPDEYADEDEAMHADVRDVPTDTIATALAQWHEAFDGATDDEVSAIVGDFNPAYDPAKRFGDDRAWAEWVREHLEREVAHRR